jgi:collagenase-like PrtC family protease
MRRMGKAAPAAAAMQAADAIYVGTEREFVRRIATFVEGQARKLVEMAAPMLKVELE